MMNNNKILTVSYGTFSCTLEGFDDSFGTMKAIAEYFRDLAADDRYFGAEPPQPDAEMLARIAQREVSRRVEAREHEGRIVLSAHEAETPAAKAPTAPAAEVEAPVATAAESTPAADAPVATAPVPPVAAAPSEEAHDIEAPQAPAAEPTEAAHVSETAQVDPGYVPGAQPPMTEGPAAPTMDEAHASAAPQEDAATEHAAPSVAERADVPDGAEAFFAEAKAADHAAELAEETAEAAPALAPRPATIPHADSIAAKLERIRAVVSRHEEIEIEATYEEDEDADVFLSGTQQDDIADAPVPASSSDVRARALQDIEGALDADTGRDAKDDDTSGPDTGMVSDDDDDLSAIMSRLNAAPAATSVEVVEETIVELTEDTGETESEAPKESAGQGFAAYDQDDDDDVTGENLFDEADTADADPAEEESHVQAQATEAEDEDEDEDADAPARPRARVIKVKRLELDDAIAKGLLEPQDEDESTAEAAQGEDHAEDMAEDVAVQAEDEDDSGSSLSAQDEAELQKELDALEAELATDAAQAEDATDDDQADEAGLDEEDEDSAAQDAVAAGDAEEDAETRRAARDALPDLDAGQDRDVSRLMQEADSQMGEQESSERRSAFAHLRAAVAAKKADQALGGDEDDGTPQEDYRSDLAEVVKPRRPVPVGGSRTPRPSDARPAPLKLVAEQRIDVEAVKPSGPVRPRRVATAAEHDVTEDDGGSFAEFAEEVGATHLPDLLEAAAAYMAFVEGRTQFSRPQLMTKVRQVEQDSFSREDGLRSFGQLLRAGKIEKIKGGRFTVSERIGFKPDDHRAAG